MHAVLAALGCNGKWAVSELLGTRNDSPVTYSIAAPSWCIPSRSCEPRREALPSCRPFLRSEGAILFASSLFLVQTLLGSKEARADSCLVRPRLRAGLLRVLSVERSGSGGDLQRRSSSRDVSLSRTRYSRLEEVPQAEARFANSLDRSGFYVLAGSDSLAPSIIAAVC